MRVLYTECEDRGLEHRLSQPQQQNGGGFCDHPGAGVDGGDDGGQTLFLGAVLVLLGVAVVLGPEEDEQEAQHCQQDGQLKRSDVSCIVCGE